MRRTMAEKQPTAGETLSAIRDGVDEWCRLIAEPLMDLHDALVEFGDCVVPWMDYRDALEVAVDALPWWERPLWRVWVWGLDRLGYHWECGPMPGGGVFYSGWGWEYDA